MVVERLKALIMSNSIDIIRKFWNVADRQKHGVVDVNQMCSLLVRTHPQRSSHELYPLMTCSHSYSQCPAGRVWRAVPKARSRGCHLAV